MRSVRLGYEMSGSTKKQTKFDWHCDAIDSATPITETYKNTQNVRRYFKSQCGDHFKFDRSFMAWFKENTGKTMGDAVEEWLSRQARKNAEP